MEMEIIPKYDFPIYGLWISGIKRSSLILNILFLGIPFILKNITLPFKILFSVIKSILKDKLMNIYHVRVEYPEKPE